MENTPRTFNIISFTAHSNQYYPASMKHASWMPDNYIKHTALDIPLGKSRYGGPVIDLPPGISHPENLRFAAQLDLKEFAPFDITGLLPKQGHLIFFNDLVTNAGKVFYADVPNEALARQIVEHEDHFFSGVLIENVFSDTESWDERFREPEYEWDTVSTNGKVWDEFAGSNRSKISGIYTHCQMGQEEIEAITFSDKVLLLQIGENGFNDEGVFSVLIPRQDLQQLNFDNCEFEWGQS